MSEAAVVILNFNGRDFLEKFLPSILEHSGNAEIVVADNASTDESVKLLEDKFPTIRIIEFSENHGFAGGYNEALKQIDAEFFAIINSDVAVTEGWLSSLMDFLKANKAYAAVQPKIKDWNNQEWFEYAGACGGFVDSLGYPYCRGRIFDTIEEDHGQYDQPIDVDWTTGACMVIRADAFHDAGGFDRDFFAHMEEIDLCWRLRSARWKLACQPKSVVYHVGGGTLHKSSPRKTYLNFRNGLSLLVKNLPFSQLVWKLPTRLALDGLAAIKFAVDTSPSHLVAILKAHFHFYLRFLRNYRKRSKTSATTRKGILISYFIQGKKQFSDLS